MYGYGCFISTNGKPPSGGVVFPSSLKLFIDAGNSSSYSGSGTTINDLTTNANNCTLLNGVGYSSSDGGIFTFDGVNDNVLTPIYSTVTEMSGMFWVNITSVSYSPKILVDAGQGYISLYVSTAGFPIFGNFGSTNVTSSTSINTNQWHSIGFSFKTGEKSNIYLDGVLTGQSASNQGNIQNNSALLKFMTDNVTFVGGKLGQAKIFSSKMETADFLSFHNEFKSRYGL